MADTASPHGKVTQVRTRLLAASSATALALGVAPLGDAAPRTTPAHLRTCSDGGVGGRPSGDPITVGSTLSLTGAFAATGVIHKIAGEQFVERLNAGGGLLGRPVQWMVLDDESDQAKVGTLYEQLITPGQGRPDHRARTRRRTSCPRWPSPSGTVSCCRSTPR